MPSRFTILGILAFWLFTSGWLFYRDIWPGLRPGEAPPFVIDLADEASARASHIRWKVFKNGMDKGYAVTSVQNNPAEDMYELHCEFKFFTHKGEMQLEPDQIIASMYGVSPEGDLRRVRVSLVFKDVPKKGASTEIFRGEIRGNVANQRFKPHVYVEMPTKFDFELQEAMLTTHGSVLNPLQPLNRLAHIRPGQRWHMTLMDPLAAVFKAQPFLKPFQKLTPEISWLDAEVRPKPEILMWGRDTPAPVPCLVIDYRGDQVVGQTWVRADDFLVLKQELDRQGEVLTLVRE